MPRFFRFLFLALPVLVYAVDSPCRGEDAAAIDKLVKQMGSKDLKEREKATEALKNIGFPALDALRNAAKGKDAEIAQSSGPPRRRDPEWFRFVAGGLPEIRPAAATQGCETGEIRLGRRGHRR